MAPSDHPSDRLPRPHAAPPGTVPLGVLLCSSDAALRETWKGVLAPQGFRLEWAERPSLEHFESGEYLLVLVDVRTFLGDESLAAVLDADLERCVWIGPAAALEHLDPAQVSRAYDVLVTPTSATVLGRRLEGWARSIRQTAAVEEMGRRVEALAEQNDRLAAGLAQAEAESKAQARERERLDQAMQRLRQVAGLSREINSLDLDLIERVSTEQLPALLGARAASLYLYDTVGDRLVLLRHTHGRPIAERVDLKDSPQSPMAVAVRRGELLLVSEFQEFERREEVVLDREFSQEYATSSCIVAPLKGGGRVRGVLNLADKVGGGPFDREIDLPVVEQIAELIGASIYNVELFQEMERRAKTDPLTDLANRRAVEDALDRETDRSRRYGSKLSVLLFDVDQLKRINDEFGHHVGDSVLQHVARVLAEAVRSVDVPGRWAGDEFLVVLPDTGAGQAGRLAKRLLVTLRDNPPQIQDQSIFSSLSAGVAEYKKNESVEDLVHRVDKAMYDAKKAGRDRIVTAD